ncbi:uncharacterized protein LOC132652505 [Meriones unguiculatus]|uniref:uncharacterized protein LOC132652505 n=1 Tax=Meriones unguiculatus TaxID=10047 RepID=UPI00293F65F8|nr:uncharacterized protein LOC132652505 [Meriones unguiculatus]
MAQRYCNSSSSKNYLEERSPANCPLTYTSGCEQARARTSPAPSWAALKAALHSTPLPSQRASFLRTSRLCGRPGSLGWAYAAPRPPPHSPSAGTPHQPRPTVRTSVLLSPATCPTPDPRSTQRPGPKMAERDRRRRLQAPPRTHRGGPGGAPNRERGDPRRRRESLYGLVLFPSPHSQFLSFKDAAAIFPEEPLSVRLCVIAASRRYVTRSYAAGLPGA